jgi:hypothetical protein
LTASDASRAIDRSKRLVVETDVTPHTTSPNTQNPHKTHNTQALLIGFLAVLTASLQYATAPSTAHFFHPSSLGVGDWGKLPLAFGNLVASFEGIGTVLPVEVSGSFLPCHA